MDSGLFFQVPTYLFICLYFQKTLEYSENYIGVCRLDATILKLYSGYDLRKLCETIDTIVDDYTDEQALDSKILFPNWHDNTAYAVNDRVRYGGRLYKVLQAHTSQSDWTPTRAPSLFAQILTGEETGEPQEWQQPDSTNAYMYGDRVIYDNKIYESTIDFNVWAPDYYPQGWTLIEDLNPPSENEDEDEEIPAWVQPDATNGYHIGDKVHYQGLIYQSLIDNNVWSPDAYPAGWTLIQ